MAALCLVLTLGHNSSAVLVRDGEVVVGYEEERFSGIKADSHFPIEAIKQIDSLHSLKEVMFVCATHWDTNADISGMDAKYWRPDLLCEFCPNAGVLSHSLSFTHHDAHMLAAKAYSELNGYTIVADGFGNFNEVLSVYNEDNLLIHRAYGYNKSLGLLYQYATAYLGMKMNQDEYKLLGYEAHVDKIFNREQTDKISEHASSLAKKYTKALLSNDIKLQYDALCSVHALPALRENIGVTLDNIMCDIGIDKSSEFDLRVCVARLVQQTVEQVMINIVKHFNITNVTLSGGVFYNVKVNNAILSLDQIETISVYPLAGDQGAGLGVYQHYFGNLVFPETLCFGQRDLHGLDNVSDKLLIIEDVTDACEIIVQALDRDIIVNVVHGDLEFGPRALGNTTTLMIPTMENVDYVNFLNGRSTVMPCAPITTKKSLFVNHHKVKKSLEHMIVTLDYVDKPGKSMRGAAHTYPFEDRYSGRPQVIYEDHWLYPVVSQFGILVNTSFNKHGAPIVMTKDQILDSFFYQLERDVKNRMITVVIP